MLPMLVVAGGGQVRPASVPLRYFTQSRCVVRGMDPDGSVLLTLDPQGQQVRAQLLGAKNFKRTPAARRLVTETIGKGEAVVYLYRGADRRLFANVMMGEGTGRAILVSLPYLLVRRGVADADYGAIPRFGLPKASTALGER